MTFTKLKAEYYDRVGDLFAPFTYSLSVKAIIQGNNLGYIFVDDVDNPHTALALTVEGYLLAGDCDNPITNAALRDFLKKQIFTGEVYINGEESMSLAVHPEAWEAVLPELIPTHEVEKLPRYHYLCHELRFDWREHLPDGYTVRRVDVALLHNEDVDWSPVEDWFEWEDDWFTEDDFLTKGVSFAVLYENAVVAWCTPDCIAGTQLDVGIFTAPEHRRKGLAAIAAAATVEYAFEHGFDAVGWHCNADNIGSWKTAEKLGFERTSKYAYYYYMYDPIDHLAELGWYHFKLGNYAKTTDYYTQLFAQRQDNPDYYYHLAAVAWAHQGNVEQALKHLNLAVDHGWTAVEWTQQQDAFAILHGLPEWDAVLTRMADKG